MAYLVNEYPKVSHSFIRREILALEALGVEVARFAVRGWDAKLVDADDQAERNRTTYLLQGGLAPLALAAGRALVGRPRAFAHALATAWRLARRAERPLPYHLIYLAQACALHAALRRAGVRHVHAHFGTNSAEVALLCASLGGVTYSFTVHGPEEFDKPEALHLARKVQQSAFVAAISQFGRSQIWRWMAPGDWPKVRVVHCALGPESFIPAEQISASPSHKLVCVGRLCPQKAQVLLVDAVAALRARGVPVELVLAGDGEMRADVEARIAALGVGAWVQITGWVDAARVRQELQSARALVLPSFAEGLPVVLMEAMALGRPVVTSAVAGIPELVQDGVHGWLVPSGDVGALTDAMAACLAASPDTLTRMGVAGQAQVARRHAVATSATRLVAAFEAAGAW